METTQTDNLFEKPEEIKELLAADGSNYEVTLLPISDVSGPDRIVAGAPGELKFPIVVITRDIHKALFNTNINKNYEIVYGQASLERAVIDGYTHIEAHVLSTVASYNTDRRKLKKLFRQ